VREFLLQQEAKRIPEQIATMALYLKNHRTTPVFTGKDLVKGVRGCPGACSEEPLRDIGWTVRIGWIAPKLGLKNTYYLTSSGEVGAKFPPMSVRRPKPPSLVGVAKTSHTQGREFVRVSGRWPRKRGLHLIPAPFPPTSRRLLLFSHS
jgi:hypothetical protein